jgi:NO-binding membrane sensor protein with MHYT domain
MVRILLISSAFSMGGVAIWSMHYIGNRGVVLFKGESELQLSYSAGFTITSFFIPIIVLLIAYVVIGGGEHPRLWRLAFGGTFAGAAICGMHYLVVLCLGEGLSIGPTLDNQLYKYV